MPEGSQEPLRLRQADQVLGDLYVIHDELEFIRDQLARKPTHGHAVPRARRLGADCRRSSRFSGFCEADFIGDAPREIASLRSQ
jgi:hypothetical protein